ncbi:MAG TPA: hypothetical protein VJT73_22070 [Polyangiaceae bacterium]|nr:hypothetical protein [Polyangiaceae bacterium]
MPTVYRDRLTLSGYRQVSWYALVAIVERVEGVSPRAATAIAQAVWMCAPRHPHGRVVWSRAAEAVKALREWLVYVEPEAATEDLMGAVEAIVNARERLDSMPLLPANDKGGTRSGRARSPDRTPLPSYAALVKMGVDVLRSEGVPLRSTRKRAGRGAFELLAEVLYWVWRKPDVRARELHRNAGSIGAVYWRAKKLERGGTLALPDSDHLLALAKTHETDGESAERSVIWIPGRPPTTRGRNS